MKVKKNSLEWTVFGVSIALTLTVFGALVYEQMATGDSPARIEITLGSPVASGPAYAVPVDVRNVGDTTAEDVQVTVTSRAGSGPETTDLVLPYVPYRSQRRAWVTFSHAPAAGQLDARVLGYREP